MQLKQIAGGRTIPESIKGKYLHGVISIQQFSNSLFLYGTYIV